MAKFALTDLLTLPNSSTRIPRLGFGVYQSPSATCIASCLHALKHGYRHIDTAQYYRNESEVGEALLQSQLKREEVFVTTKILAAGGSVEKSWQKCVDSIEKIHPGDGGYVDLFLIHSPNSGAAKRKEMWLALERLLEEGRVKAIGVSNYGVGHIEEMKAFAKVWPPHVNQIEVSNIILHEPRMPIVAIDIGSDDIIASPMVSAADHHRVLCEAGHCRGSLLATGPEP